MTTTSARLDALAKLKTDLAWRGPTGRAMGNICISREQAEALVAFESDPIAMMDEICRLAITASRMSDNFKETLNDYKAVAAKQREAGAGVVGVSALAEASDEAEPQDCAPQAAPAAPVGDVS